MKRRSASCPSCAGPLVFELGAYVAVCDFCQSVVARTDRKPIDFGRVADLVETSSRLRRGLTGTFNRKRFTIVGRVQYRHPAGGVWDEWYLSLPAGRWAWLSEAQGKTYLLFPRRIPNSMALPSFEELEAGDRVRFGEHEFAVTELGTAETLSAEGQVPWHFRSGVSHPFADMAGPDGAFATMEFGDGVQMFVGREISLDDLELQGEGWHQEADHVAVDALTLNCPNCGGQLVLRVPDQAQRVTCQHCSSLLDADSGKLSYFKTLRAKEYFKPTIPLGSRGSLLGHRFTVIGFLHRFAIYEGNTFPWSEYLLYEPSIGFRWLVENDCHWSFVEPVSAGDVSSPGGHGTTVRYDGDTFRLYDRGTAYVRYVLGEFYWKVETGDNVQTADFIAPPRMLSYEISGTKKSQEINISVGTYVTREEIMAAFGVTRLPTSWSVGPIQPAAKIDGKIFLLWLGFIVALLFLFLANAESGTARGADPAFLFIAIALVSVIPVGAILHRHSFEVKRWENSDYSPYASE